MRKLSFLSLFLALFSLGCEEQFDAPASNQNPASSAAVVSEVQQWYNNIPEVKGGEAARKGKKKSKRLGVPVIHWDRVKVNDYGNGRYMVTAPVTSDVPAGRSIFQLVVLRDNDRINAFISEVIPDKAFFRRDENYKFSGQIKILSKTGRQLKTYKFENGQEVDFYKNATSTLRIANDEYGDYQILDEIFVQGTYNDYDDYYVGIGYTDWDDYWDDYYDNEWDDGWGSPGYAIDQYYEDEYYYSEGGSGSDNITIVEDSEELREFELGYRARMTAAEIAIYDKMSRINQVNYLLNALKATNEAKELYPHLSQHNDKADAFRHAYFSLLNAIDLGVSLAKSLGDAHEDFAGNPPLEKEMDLYNNLKGREALSAAVQSSDDPLSLIQNLADNGSLKIIKSGSLVKSNQ